MGLSDRYCWRSDKTIPWLKVRGLVSVSRTIREEIGALVSNLDKYQDSAPTAGRWWTDDKSRASDDPPPRLQEMMLPMSRRLNREFCADFP